MTEMINIPKLKLISVVNAVLYINTDNRQSILKQQASVK